MFELSLRGTKMFRNILIIVLISVISGTSLSAAVNFPNSMEVAPLIYNPISGDNCSSQEHGEID